MRDITREWVERAEEDFTVIDQLFLHGTRPPLGAICFHSQQCVEKYIKAFLIEHDIPFERTHNLVILIDLALALRPEWILHRDALGVLTNFAVTGRYPFETPVDRNITQSAVDIALQIREVLRAELLPNQY